MTKLNERVLTLILVDGFSLRIARISELRKNTTPLHAWAFIFVRTALFVCMWYNVTYSTGSLFVIFLVGHHARGNSLRRGLQGSRIGMSCVPAHPRWYLSETLSRRLISHFTSVLPTLQNTCIVVKFLFYKKKCKKIQQNTKWTSGLI